MAVVLAVLAAIGWGASDYFGGEASSERVSVFVVLAISELLAVVPLVPVLAARGVPPPTSPRLLLAVLAGIAVTAELALIYRALSRGQAFITAPTGALGSAGAVAVGLLTGNPLGLLLAAGLICALAGSGVTAWTSPVAADIRVSVWESVAVCLGAAAAVATMLTALHGAARLDPYWVTAVEHVATGVCAGACALLVGGRSAETLPRRSLLPKLSLIAIAGLGGDLAYTNASHGGGRLSIIAAISALYPVTTIVLARVLQARRPSRTQLIGVVLALAGGAVLAAASP